MFTKNLKTAAALFVSLAVAAATAGGPTFSAGKDAASKAGFDPSKLLPWTQIGIYAQDLETGKTVLEYGADQSFQPASTLKVVTALTASLALGQNYQFKTGAYTNGSISGGTLTGNLLFVFDGDPSLTSKSLASLAKQLKDSGITRVNGEVWMAVGKYNGHDRPVGWNDSNLGSCYSSPNSAAQVDYSCAGGSLKLNAGPGSVARFDYGANHSFRVTSQVRIVSPDNAGGCELNYVQVSATAAELRGCIAQSRNSKWMNLSVIDGNDFARNQLANALKSAGISFKSVKISQEHVNQQQQPLGPSLAGGLTGNKPSSTNLRKVEVKFAGKTYSEITAVRSAPVGVLIKQMLHQSENHIAEQLYRASAYVINNNRPVNYTTATTLNYGRLSLQPGLDLNFKSVDGSGLSYYNLVTPRAMTAFIRYIYQNDAHLNLISKFPTQTEGTLRSYKGFNGLGERLWGKTGSIYGATNFTGVVVNDQGRKIALTLFINNNPNSSSTATAEFHRRLFRTLGATPISDSARK